MAEVLNDDEVELNGHVYTLTIDGDTLAQADHTLAQYKLGHDVRSAFASGSYLAITICLASFITTDRRRVNWKKLSKLFDKIGRHKFKEMKAKASPIVIEVFRELGELENEEVEPGEEQAGLPETRASASSGSPAATTSPSTSSES